MSITVKEVADLVGGNIVGNPECKIIGVSKIHEAKPNELTFLYLPAYSKYLNETRASAILVTPDEKKVNDSITYIEVEKPDIALQLIIRSFFKPEIKISGIDSSAAIADNVKIGNNVKIGKNAVISEGCSVGDNSIIHHNTVLMENVSVGDNTLIYPNVTVREECIIGSDVIIHSGTVIGSDGFGYSPRKEGGYDKVPQIGNVVLEDQVEIGSNVSIDRAAMGSTIIKKELKSIIWFRLHIMLKLVRILQFLLRWALQVVQKLVKIVY
jgi:UDP-3-O-[3-hydroxymyristoyl] glucosamine N-acyltransferase